MERVVLKARGKFIVIAVAACLGLCCAWTSVWAAEPVKVGYTIFTVRCLHWRWAIDLKDGFNLYMDEIGHKAGGRKHRGYCGRYRQ